jgi:formate hydrogenlyase subunit 4
MIMSVFIWVLQIVFVPVVSPLCVGCIRKIKAKMQNRIGASIFQPYLDLAKLLQKDEVISEDASWIFKFAPYVIFASTIVIGASIPILTTILNSPLAGDLLTIVYLLAIGTFFLALAGMDTGSAFGGFGSSREMTISALAEGGLIFSLLAASLLAGTTNLFAISGADLLSSSENFLPLALAFVGFFLVMLAETARYPYDNPSTHLELTMVHEAMILEYSGKRLALIEWASSNKLLIFFMLGANVFFPWGIATTAAPGAVLLALGAIALKLVVFCAAVAILESVMAKFRFFRLPDILITSFILSATAIGFLL